MSKRTTIIVVATLAVLIVAGLVFGFLQTHERQEVEVDPPPDLEARVNPHLGLERFLEAVELDVDPSPDAGDYRDLWEADVLFFSPQLAVFDGWQEPVGLLQEDPGQHLVIVGQFDDGTSGEFKNALDVETLELDDDFPFHRDRVAEYDYDASSWAEDHWLFDDTDDDFDDFHELLGWFQQEELTVPASPDFVAVDDEDNVLAVSSRKGAGRLTVIPESNLVTNQGLEAGEVGQLLADLFSLDGHWPADAVLALQQESEGWFGTVFERGWPVFAGFALLLILGLTRARRFGPEIPERPTRRQRRSDHIRATGRFLWNHHGRDAMVEATRRALIDRITTIHPSVQTLQDDQRIETIAERLDVKPRTVRWLLEGAIPRNASDFREMIDELEKLRRKL